MTAREVELTGGAPWGFRMHGGVDQNQPLRISRRYSDTVESALSVNPGRKASLSGIREGDVISSINGRPTRSMSNSEAHAMLRSAGPILRLGLNEDRDTSPRRRSIGKGGDLKRPSQLIAEVQKAIPQAPVYATIRPAQSPHIRPSSSPMRSSLNSLPSALNSTPLVKSVAANEEPPRFHPTNPFYTTLPSNYSSASKLPVPNGRATLSSVDRNKSKDTNSYSDYGSELKSPSYFTRTYDSGHGSLPPYHNNTETMNGYESGASKSTANDASDPFSYSSFSQYDNQSLPNDKNPFETKRNSDPFEKYLRPESNLNGKEEYDSKPMSNSQSDNNFRSKEEITKRSTITEHKINEIEEIKTIKKIILNGSGDTSDHQNDQPIFSSSTKNRGYNHFNFDNHSQPKDNVSTPKNEHIIHVQTPTQQRNDHYSSPFGQKEDRSFSTSTNSYQSAAEYKPRAEAPAPAPATEAVASKPPVKSPPAPAPVPSPTQKRE